MPVNTNLVPHHVEEALNEHSRAVKVLANPITAPGPFIETRILDIQDGSESTGPSRLQLYFAFGSNLSHTQMRQRCTGEISAKPLAIARLRGWRWIISGRGVANIVPVHEYSDSIARRTDASQQRAVSEEREEARNQEDDHVYGIVYAMTPKDEGLLDETEKVDNWTEETPLTSSVEKETRPRNQEEGAYNKWYLAVHVVHWLDDKFRAHCASRVGEGEDGDLTVLVYIDEHVINEGKPREEYVKRMNQAIKEAVELGLPQDWVNKVVRRFIPEN